MKTSKLGLENKIAVLEKLPVSQSTFVTTK